MKTSCLQPTKPPAKSASPPTHFFQRIVVSPLEQCVRPGLPGIGRTPVSGSGRSLPCCSPRTQTRNFGDATAYIGRNGNDVQRTFAGYVDSAEKVDGLLLEARKGGDW